MNGTKVFRQVLAVGILIFAGCASHPKGNPGAIDWNSRMGSYTYGQAVAELGNPSATGESSSGRFAEWIIKRSPQMSFGFGVGTGMFGSHRSVGAGVGTEITPRPSGEYLHLEFDTAGQLKEWRKVRY